MIHIHNKNNKFLSLVKPSNIEKYLQELVNLSFEYSSNFIFIYSIEDFSNTPINLPYEVTLNNCKGVMHKVLFLLNLYLERDPFYNLLYSYLAFRFKIKYNQFMQIVSVKGDPGFNNLNVNMLSNLQYGLTVKDFILAAFKTRESIIDSSVNIYTSGYLTRKLVEGLRNICIKNIKCGTNYKCKDFIRSKHIQIPFLCGDNISTCSFCLNIDSSLNIISGYNKGVISGQALGEPSTQMLLRTFHLGSKGIKAVQEHYFRLSNEDVENTNTLVKERFETSKISDIGILNCGKTQINGQVNEIEANKGMKFNFYNNISTLTSNDNIKFMVLYNSLKTLWSFIKLCKNTLTFKEKKYEFNTLNKKCCYKY